MVKKREIHLEQTPPTKKIGCFVTLVAIGKPWCETGERGPYPFRECAEQSYNRDGAPRTGIDSTTCFSEGEFLTAMSTRPGGHALLKPKDATFTDHDPGVCSRVVKVGFRQVTIPKRVTEFLMKHEYKGIYATKTKKPWNSWAVVPLNDPMNTFKHRRDEIMRPHPSAMKDLFSKDDMNRVFKACEGALAHMLFRMDSPPYVNQKKSLAN